MKPISGATITLLFNDWLDGIGNSFDTIRPDGQFAIEMIGSSVYLTYAIPEPGGSWSSAHSDLSRCSQEVAGLRSRVFPDHLVQKLSMIIVEGEGQVSLA